MHRPVPERYPPACARSDKAWYRPDMSRVIEVAFSGDPNAVVTKARATAERHGAKFSGDHVAGTFAGNGIEGNYRFTDTLVIVTVEKKPDFAPWPLVETAIRGFFESPAPAPIAKAEAGADVDA